jgi:hypothetical protein
MTSEARTFANRRNAKKSTGPRSSAGKARSSGNARKHGLSSHLARDEDVARLVQALAPGEDRPQVLAHIWRVAEAIERLERVEALERQIIDAAECQLLALAPHLAPGGRLEALKTASLPSRLATVSGLPQARQGFASDVLVTLTAGASANPLARRAAAKHAARLELTPIDRYRKRALSALRTALTSWISQL